VLAGYVGVACGLFAAALAGAAYVVVFLFFFVPDIDQSGLLFSLAVGALTIVSCASPFLILGVVAGVQALITRIRFSRLLRRPSDPCTATVTASKRGGRTLTLDIPPAGRGYQSLSEVRLALWMKAGMLVPGETVNVWSGGKSELLISGPQRGRAFLGTVTSQSAVQPSVRSGGVPGLAADRPAVRPPDTMKVRGRLRGLWLALWLAGAAGCIALGVYGDTPEDRLFLALFLLLAALSVGGAVRSFGRGLDADGNGVVVRNTFRPTLIPWRDLAAIEFKGVEKVWDAEGDMYYKLVFQRHDGSRVTAEAPGGGTRPGEYLFELRERLLAMRYVATWPLLDASNPTTQTDTPPTTATWPLLEGPDWAAWADSTRFSITGRLRAGYATAEVDALRQEIRDTFLGVRQPPLTSHAVHGMRFSTHRHGYDVEQVDAFLDQAELRLAAMRPTDVVVEVQRMKITIVYESMFGNTRKVAGAISDGVREAHPDAHVECVAVRRASAELIKSTDLLVVGGPTHLRHMATDFSRKRQISAERKAEAKGEPARELELDAAGPGLREWFHQLPRAKEGGHASAFDTRLGSALAGGAAYGIAHRVQRHGYYLVKSPEGFILDEAHGPLHAGEIERAKEWGAQLVRASVSTTATPAPTVSGSSERAWTSLTDAE
jgi:DivIVA domain-containing protein